MVKEAPNINLLKSVCKHSPPRDGVHVIRASKANLPWDANDGGEGQWSRPRRFAAGIVYNPCFFVLIFTTLTVNACISVLEIDNWAKCFPAYEHDLPNCPFKWRTDWMSRVETGLLGFYTLELLARLFVQREVLFKSHWNQLDVIVVLSGWLGTLFEGGIYLPYLRLLRFVQVIRVLRVLDNVPELHLLIHGMASAMRAMVFSCILIFAVLLGFALVLVSVVHPQVSRGQFDGCQHCNDAFKSVGHAFLTLFQETIAGGSWLFSTRVMGTSWLTTFLVTLATATISLGILNLTLSVIVEQAASARDRDTQELLSLHSEHQAEAKETLLKLCMQLDKDGSGKLHLEQFLDYYGDSEEYHTALKVLNMEEQELICLFEHLDREESGHFSYEEFCDEILQLKSYNQKLQIAMLRLKLLDSNHMLEKRLSSQIACLGSDLLKVKNCVQNIVGAAGVGDQVKNCIQDVVGGETVGGRDESSQQLYPASQMHVPVLIPQKDLGVGAKLQQVVQQLHQEVLMQNLASAESLGGGDEVPQQQHPTSQMHVPVLIPHKDLGVEMKSQQTFKQLHLDVQRLLELEIDIMRNTLQTRDFRLEELTNSLYNVMMNTHDNVAQDIRTLELWLVQQKLEQCQRECQSLLEASCDMQMENRQQRNQLLPTGEAVRYDSSCIRTINFKLIGLLPQLFQLSTMGCAW